MGGYEDLAVWQRGRRLVVLIYDQTKSFPKSEQFGITGQMRRAAVSVVANLAEGSARGGPSEFAYFVNIARGSAAELETLLMVAADVGLLDSDVSAAIRCDVRGLRKMLHALHRSLKRRVSTP